MPSDYAECPAEQTTPQSDNLATETDVFTDTESLPSLAYYRPESGNSIPLNDDQLSSQPPELTRVNTPC